MADSATTQNPADVDSQKPADIGGDKPKTNKIQIGVPFEVGGRADNIIRFIQVDGGPKLKSGWKVRDGSRVEVFGKGLERYNQVALWIGGGRELIEGGNVRRKSGDEGLEFTAKFGSSLYADGLPIEVEFLQYNRPDNDRSLEKHFFYSKESEEEAQKRKAAEQESGQTSEGRSASTGPAGLMMESLGDTLGGIAGALKSTTGASSAGAKTVSQSGTATAGGAGKSMSAKVSGGGGDEAEVYGEETASQAATSTEEISTGGQTISESGTVTAGGQTVTEGSTGVAQTVSVGGTVQPAAAGGVSEEVSSTVSGGVTGSSTSNTTVTQGASVSGGVSGTADISSKAVFSGQTKVETKVTGKTSSNISTKASGATTASDKVSGTENVKQEASQGGAVSGKAETKTEAKVSQSFKSSGTTQTQAANVAPAPAPALPKSLEATQTSLGTAGMGMGLPSFGGGTMPKPPAGLGSMKQKGAELNLNLNIAGGSAPLSPVISKPAAAGTGAGQLPKKLDQTKPPEPPAKEDGGLPAQQPNAGKIPANEAKPPSEAPKPAGPAAPPKDTQVPPPLGQGGGLPSQRPDGSKRQQPPQPGGQPGKPIDSANGLKKPDEKNKQKPGDSPMGEPLQAPQAPEKEGGTPDGQPAPGGKGGGPPGAEPPASSLPSEALNAAQGAREGAKLGAQLGPEGALAGAALGALANTRAGQKILQETEGKAVSKVWYYGFGSSCATFFTGLDFMLGAVVMDAYWIFGHRKNPKLFPLKGWQKAVTVAANVIPPFLIALIIALIMVAGCNWPAPIKTPKGNVYSFTVIGYYIQDNCKYFDVSNTATFGGGDSGGAGASSSWNASSNTTGPITPR